LKLHEWGPDFAVWCNYKYLNGGPGCVGGCFVHERHAHAWELPRFAGWWGHDERTRFEMGPDFQPMSGADGWQLSNPSIVSLAVLRASLDLFHEATMERLRAKSISLTGYLEFLLNHCGSTNFSIVTPSKVEQLPQNGQPLCERLVHEGIIGDWREPDTFRVAPVPLYNSFHDVFQFVRRFAGVIN
jgi:kynureninase